MSHDRNKKKLDFVKNSFSVKKHITLEAIRSPPHLENKIGIILRENAVCCMSHTLCKTTVREIINTNKSYTPFLINFIFSFFFTYPGAIL